MPKVEPGTYQCKTTAATIYEAPSGAVMCRIGLDLGLTGGICLIQKDGTLSERGFKDVQAILGMSGAWDWDAWSADPETWSGHDVEAVVETVQGDKGEFSSVKYLNPIGGGQKLEKADAKVLAAKYGAKTRALFGGTPAPAKKPAPKQAPKPPAPKGETSTMEACWEAYLEAGASDDADGWYQTIRDVTGKDQNDCTPDDWGKLMKRIKDDSLPFDK